MFMFGDAELGQFLGRFLARKYCMPRQVWVYGMSYSQADEANASNKAEGNRLFLSRA